MIIKDNIIYKNKQKPNKHFSIFFHLYLKIKLNEIFSIYSYGIQQPTTTKVFQQMSRRMSQRLNSNEMSQRQNEHLNMRKTYVTEKNRIFKLRCDTKKTFQEKSIMINIASSLNIPKSQLMIDCENYYNASDNYLKYKIEFWDGCIQSEIHPYLLPKLQETMAEWLETGWAYLGQEDIKQQSDDAKDEFKFMKRVCNHLTPKHKARRNSNRVWKGEPHVHH